jgi:drug/metabolite transporter (DMT)-like permease
VHGPQDRESASSHGLPRRAGSLTRRRAILFLVLGNLLSAGTYVAGKAALRDVTPVELNGFRFAIAALCFLPILSRSRPLRVRRRDLPRLGLLTLLGFVLNKGIEYTGLKLTTASDTAILIACEGVFTSVFGWALLRERVRTVAVCGLLLSVLGAYLVIERGLVPPRLGGGTRVVGDLLVVAALVFEALYSVLGKATLSRYPGSVITGLTVGSSLLVWLPAAAANATIAGVPHLDAAGWLGVLYLGALGTTAAYTLWILGLARVDAATAAPFLLLQPLAGSLLAVLLLGDRLSAATVAGGALILAGITLVTRGEQGSGELIPPSTA